MLRSPPTSSGFALPDAFAPRAVEQLLRLRGDLRLGLPVILQGGGEQAMVALVESLTEDRFRAMASVATPALALTRRRAQALGIEAPDTEALDPEALNPEALDTEALPTRGSDVLSIAVPQTAGIEWLTAVAGEGLRDDLTGLLAGAPFNVATSTQVAAIRLAKSSQAMPAVLTVPFDGRDDLTGLMTMHLDGLNSALDEARAQERVSSASLPMAVSGAGRVHVFRPDDGGADHYAIEVGAPDLSRPVTVRLHSACFTGDVLGSLKCDCGPQLRAAITEMAQSGGGVLLYLNQEGRGIGLANKLRAYVLQDAGLDTVEANHWLGFEDDQRDFRIGATILQELGISAVRLMTNNPAKARILANHGLDVVERMPLKIGSNEHNARYLATKARKSGHLL